MREFRFNSPLMMLRRRKLRNFPTSEEKRLWEKLKKSGLRVKFRRQYSVGPYVVDFYCPEFRLGVEIDGGKHLNREEKEYDQFRSRYLNGHNIRIIRFWNWELEKDIEEVIGKIKQVITPS